MQRWWKTAGSECLEKTQPCEELIPFRAICVFQLSVGKLGPVYCGEEKTAKILNNFLLLKLILRFRRIPGVWASVSEAGYSAEARLTFPARFLFPQLRSWEKKKLV